MNNEAALILGVDGRIHAVLADEHGKQIEVSTLVELLRKMVREELGKEGLDEKVRS